VVVDAVNDSVPARGTWKRAAEATSAALLIAVLAMEDADVHRARLEGRVRPFERIAEPMWLDVLERIAAEDPWDEDVLHLDAARTPRELAEAVLSALPRTAPPDDAA
jgi:hypothetical protein